MRRLLDGIWVGQEPGARDARAWQTPAPTEGRAASLASQGPKLEDIAGDLRTAPTLLNKIRILFGSQGCLHARGGLRS